MIIKNDYKDYVSKNNNEQYKVKVEVNYDVSNDKYNIVKVEDKVKDKQYRVVGDYANESRGRKLYK